MESHSKIVINEMRNALVATIQVSLSNTVLCQFRAELLEIIESNEYHYLILDFSGLEIMDRAEFEELRSIVSMAYLMGVTSYFASLKPEVAATLIQLDVDTLGIKTALNLEDAFAAIRSACNK